MLPKQGILLQSYTEMIKVPVFLTGHRCVYENKKRIRLKGRLRIYMQTSFIWGFYS